MHGWIDGQIARQTDRQTCGFLISRMYVFFIYAFIIILYMPLVLYMPLFFIYAFLYFEALTPKAPAARRLRALPGLFEAWQALGGFLGAAALP